MKVVETAIFVTADNVRNLDSKRTTQMLSTIEIVFVLAMLLTGDVAAEKQETAVGTGNRTLSVSKIDRINFPSGFLFGVASSAYQVEGAVREGGRRATVCDTTYHIPGSTADGDNADVACDSYHKYKDDINLISNIGFDAYRFSIAWSRIFPDGDAFGVNADGVEYYNRLIDGLLERGIQPFVTLLHWDLPQTIMDSFGGYESKNFVAAFAKYAETCFSLFGDRVKHWMTINEPNFIAASSNRCSTQCSTTCSMDSTASLYLAGHNIILAHAAAVRTYRTEFQAQQKGVIGIPLDIQWYGPLTDSDEDLQTHQLAMALRYGWFLDPFVYGDYPEILRKFAGQLLPTFSPEESQWVKGSLDFVGVNHYTSHYVTSKPMPNFTLKEDRFPDSASIYVGEMRNGVPIGPQASWIFIVPYGIQKVLDYLRLGYNNPVIYITENGLIDANDRHSIPLSEKLNDYARINYYQGYLESLLLAIRDGANVRGYFCWSLLDSFEWTSGYTSRFGLHAVDRITMARYPKASARWFQQIFIGTSAVNSQKM